MTHLIIHHVVGHHAPWRPRVVGSTRDMWGCLSVGEEPSNYSCQLLMEGLVMGILWL